MIYLIRGIFAVIGYLLNFLVILFFVSMLLRFVRADQSNPIVRTVYVLTDRPSSWLCRRLPWLMIRGPGYFLDMSPLLIVILIGVLQVFLPYLQAALLDLF